MSKKIANCLWLIAFTLCYSLFATSGLYALFGGPGAGSTYGTITKTIAIASGTATPSDDRGAWSGSGRAAITNDVFQDMTPVGDGTYYKGFNLSPGAYYNFQFTGYTGANPPKGLTANTTYNDPVPSGGNADAGFIVARTSENPTGTAVAGNTYYGSTQDGARRYVRIPYDVDTTKGGAWVYCNWGSTPNVNMDAYPTGGTSVRIEFNAGWWGLGESNKSLDVAASSETTAAYTIYFASNVAGQTPDTYRLMFSTPGWSDYADHTGLVQGGTYYYIATASDAYKGALNPSWPSVEACYQVLIDTIGADADPTGRAITDIPYYVSARPSASIPVYFKVENIDWDYIEKHGYVVYLTPYNCYDERLPYRIPGKICRVYLPKT